MSRFVLDNTVTMAWCFTEEATEHTRTLLNRLSNLTDRAIVPALLGEDRDSLKRH